MLLGILRGDIAGGCIAGCGGERGEGWSDGERRSEPGNAWKNNLLISGELVEKSSREAIPAADFDSRDAIAKQ